MDGIREVTEEFYGRLSSKKPFNSLEKLEFEDMPEWKQWHVLGNGEFPTLEKLSIQNCPQLSLETPVQFSSLKRFQVIGSPLFTCQLEGMKQIVELYAYNCNSLTSFPFSILPSTLKRLSIYRWQKLNLEATVDEMYLEYLKLEKCDCIDDISPDLLPRARNLVVESCHNLTRFLIPTATESLNIINCKNVEIFSVAFGGAQMTHLYIYNCRKLPERMQELLPSLKRLQLLNCPEIESFPGGGLPFNLQDLTIWNCTKLVNGRKEWRLQRLHYLRMLVIEHDGSDEDIDHWELPCSIQRLTIRYLKTLSSQLLKSLNSLEYLCIEGNLPHIQFLLEEGKLPSSLSELYLGFHHELHSLGLCHLTSLQSLYIWNCPNLQSLLESALPSSLSQLTIRNCPNLQSLPVKGMSSSLSKLDISKCPLLTPLLEFDKGDYWPNIAQIPNIVIDWECL